MFICSDFVTAKIFSFFKKWLISLLRCMNLELQVHTKAGFRAILQMKPCTPLNLARLITPKVPHEKFLRMSDYRASSNRSWKPRVCVVFYNNAPQSKAVTVNNKRKIFSFLSLLSWRRRSSVLTRTLIPADASIASVSHLQYLLNSGLHCRNF